MKANELMIGDWVRIKSDIEPDDAYWLHDMQPGQALKATEILSDGINPDWYDGEINDYVPEDAIEPIPLTPEILEKNGFRFNGTNVWEYKDKGREKYEISACPRQPDNEWWDEFATGFEVHTKMADVFLDGVKNIYVHELQHALRLCGIDNKITL